MKPHRLLILKINIQMKLLLWVSESVSKTNTTAWVYVTHRPYELNMPKSEDVTLST